jgi:hypothetical protein
MLTASRRKPSKTRLAKRAKLNRFASSKKTNAKENDTWATPIETAEDQASSEFSYFGPPATFDDLQDHFEDYGAHSTAKNREYNSPKQKAGALWFAPLPGEQPLYGNRRRSDTEKAEMRVVRAVIKKILAREARFRPPDQQLDDPKKTRKRIRDLKKLTLAELEAHAENQALRYAVYEDAFEQPPDSLAVDEEPVTDSTSEEANAWVLKPRHLTKITKQMKFKTPAAKEKITAQKSTFDATTTELSSKLLELLRMIMKTEILSAEDCEALNESGTRFFGSWVVQPIELTPKLHALRWLVESQPFALFSLFIKKAIALWLVELESKIELADQTPAAGNSPKPYAEIRKRANELKTLVGTAPIEPVRGISNPNVVNAILSTTNTILATAAVTSALRPKASQWMQTLAQRGWGFWPEVKDVKPEKAAPENRTTDASDSSPHPEPIKLTGAAKTARADDVTIESSYAAFKRALRTKNQTETTAATAAVRGRTAPKQRYRPETDPWLVEYGGETRSIAWWSGNEEELPAQDDEDENKDEDEDEDLLDLDEENEFDVAVASAAGDTREERQWKTQEALRAFEERCVALQTGIDLPAAPKKRRSEWEPQSLPIVLNDFKEYYIRGFIDEDTDQPPKKPLSGEERKLINLRQRLPVLRSGIKNRQLGDHTNHPDWLRGIIFCLQNRTCWGLDEFAKLLNQKWTWFLRQLKEDRAWWRRAIQTESRWRVYIKKTAYGRSWMFNPAKKEKVQSFLRKIETLHALCQITFQRVQEWNQANAFDIVPLVKRWIELLLKVTCALEKNLKTLLIATMAENEGTYMRSVLATPFAETYIYVFTALVFDIEHAMWLEGLLDGREWDDDEPVLLNPPPFGEDSVTIKASWFIHDLASYVEETMRSVINDESETHYERSDVLRYFALWLLNEYCFDKKVKSDAKAKARVARKVAKAKAARKAAALAAKAAKTPACQKTARLKMEKEAAPQKGAAKSVKQRKTGEVKN